MRPKPIRLNLITVLEYSHSLCEAELSRWKVCVFLDTYAKINLTVSSHTILGGGQRLSGRTDFKPDPLPTTQPLVDPPIYFFKLNGVIFTQNGSSLSFITLGCTIFTTGVLPCPLPSFLLNSSSCFIRQFKITELPHPSSCLTTLPISRTFSRSLYIECGHTRFGLGVSTIIKSSNSNHFPTIPTMPLPSRPSLTANRRIRTSLLTA